MACTSASPSSLQETCVDFICEHWEKVCTKPPISEIQSTLLADGEAETQIKLTNSGSRLLFKDTQLHPKTSEQLLAGLSEKGKLSDLTMSLFDSNLTLLRNVCLRNSGELTTKGLRALMGHEISNLEVSGISIPLHDLIGCLGEWTLQNLKNLNVTRSPFLDLKNCETLSNLRSLASLNVSYTEFNSHSLGIVVENLPHLECLDISYSNVDDISSLLKYRDCLKCLVMYNLKACTWKNLISVVLDLHELRVLDMSDENPDLLSKVTDLLTAVDKLPHITNLDISGKYDIKITDLRLFLKYHKHLTFLGLIYSDVCSDDIFTNPSHDDYDGKLLVTGTATESQILESLRRYSDRPAYVRMCLYHVCRLASNFGTARVDIIELVLSCMLRSRQHLGVQIAATICLYNLTKGDLIEEIHPKILKRIVDQILTAMETFPDHYRLQYHSLRTLCCGRIGQEVSFDKFRCARLVLNALCAFEDELMNKAGIEICLFLTDSISSSVDSLLEGQPLYMRKLLAIARNKLHNKTIDITFNSIISILWNVADNSPTTCRVFLEEGGMALFLETMKIFKNEETIEGLVLGVFNKIARVKNLRRQLMTPEFICLVRNRLYSRHHNVSCFAAAILSKLLSDTDAWNLTTVSGEQMEQELLTLCLCGSLDSKK